jgi:hypothetical protein
MEGGSLLDRLQRAEPTEKQLKQMSFLEEKRTRIDVDCRKLFVDRALYNRMV